MGPIIRRKNHNYCFSLLIAALSSHYSVTQDFAWKVRCCCWHKMLNDFTFQFIWGVNLNRKFGCKNKCEKSEGFCCSDDLCVISSLFTMNWVGQKVCGEWGQNWGISYLTFTSNCGCDVEWWIVMQNLISFKVPPSGLPGATVSNTFKFSEYKLILRFYNSIST